MTVRKNDVLEVEIIDLTYKAYGLAKVNGFSVFIENALPNEIVEIRIEKVLKRFAFGKLLNVIKASKDRVEIKDPMGTRIGTMPLQHLKYEAQLDFKKNLVEMYLKKQLESIPTVLPTLGMKDPWKYRNKAQIPARMINDTLETGFFKRNSHDLVPIENFYIQEAEIDEAIVIVRDLLRKYGILAYDEENHTGCIRHVIVRRGHYSKEMMIILVTLGQELPYRESLVRDILDQVSNTVSIIQNINEEKTNVIMGEHQEVLFGEDVYYDNLFDLKFAISSKSFFQVNTKQTEVLYSKAIELAQITKNDIAVDAYCGIGTISLIAAQEAKHVYGVEIVDDAITMAQHNASLNNIDNTTFVSGKAEEVMPLWVSEGIKPDVLIVDPPRKGLDETFINSAIQSNPNRIVYVSCNPETLARDVKLFVEQGYSIKTVQPVDMFPHSTHVESIVLMVKE